MIRKLAYVKITFVFHIRYVGLYDTWIPTIMIKDLELIKQLAIKDFETFHDHRTFDLGDNEDLFGSNLFILKGMYV